MYIPDASKWLQFYKDKTNKLVATNTKKRGQRGGSLVNMVKTSILPVGYKRKTDLQMGVNDIPVKIVSPSQAIVDQAKTEINRKAHVKKGTKRKRSRNSSSRGGKRQRSKSSKLVNKKIKVKSVKIVKKRKSKKIGRDIFD